MKNGEVLGHKGHQKRVQASPKRGVEYIIESGRRERRERVETYNRLHCIE
jgi:hypothetical protein